MTFEEWFDGWDSWKSDEERNAFKVMMSAAWQVACEQAALEERNRCAKVCDELSRHFSMPPHEGFEELDFVLSDGAHRCASAIREGT